MYVGEKRGGTCNTMWGGGSEGGYVRWGEGEVPWVGGGNEGDVHVYG